MDLIARLKKPMAWARVYGGTVTADDTPFEAAKEIERLRLALRIIAGEQQCIDNLMSNGDVARAALQDGR